MVRKKASSCVVQRKRQIQTAAIGVFIQKGFEKATIKEIARQDSKLIIIRDGIVVDFAMNTVCTAGTGSFLYHQVLRLGQTIDDFSRLALTSTNLVRIAGRCTVSAESGMNNQITECRGEY
jgi:activator of 2-hydroxyglutaryl-CoA dehydratase